MLPGLQPLVTGGSGTKRFPDADRLLANRIDKLVWQFRASAPEFYEKYRVTRAIVDPPTAGTDAPAPAAKAA